MWHPPCEISEKRVLLGGSESAERRSIWREESRLETIADGTPFAIHSVGVSQSVRKMIIGILTRVVGRRNWFGRFCMGGG